MTTLYIVTFYTILAVLLLLGFVAGWKVADYHQKRKH